MTQNQAGHKNYALPIAIMFALFFMIAFVTGYQNPLGSVIKKMLGDNIFLTQLGTFANFIAYAFMGYPAGKLLERHGYRRTAMAAVTVGFVGVLITYLSGYILNDNTTAVSVYIIGAFVAGFSMCMLNTVVNPMLNSLGKNQNQGNQFIQFGGACNSIGATLAPVIVGSLLGGTASTISAANPVFYLAMGIFAVAFIILYVSRLPEPHIAGEKRESISAAGAFRYRNFTFGVIAIFCYVGIEVGIANWTLQYVENSPAVSTNALAPATIAGSVAGVYWLLMLVGRLIGGAVGNRISSRTMLAVTSAVAICLLIIGIYMPETSTTFFGFKATELSFFSVQIPANAIFLILCGLCTSVMWGAIFNLSVEGLGKYTAVASGLFMVMVCGGGILPFIQGLIAKGCGILAGFWLTVAAAAYILLYALVLSRPKKA